MRVKNLIRAECHSDDHNVEVDFDATEWFRQASEKDVLALAQCGWGGDYAADAVAIHMADSHPKIASMFQYLHIIRDDPTKKDCGGFECHVNGGDALAWVRSHRRAWARKVRHVADDPASYDATTGEVHAWDSNRQIV